MGIKNTDPHERPCPTPIGCIHHCWVIVGSYFKGRRPLRSRLWKISEMSSSQEHLLDGVDEKIRQAETVPVSACLKITAPSVFSLLQLPIHDGASALTL